MQVFEHLREMIVTLALEPGATPRADDARALQYPIRLRRFDNKRPRLVR
ncbi:hypothetical protein HF313_13510 [Massilia atriviolacea]|nr:hypothetical protein [Massilia atriviolacea]